MLARLPNTVVELVARTLEPVTTDRGMQILPTVTYEKCPPLEVIMVPGGAGQQDLMEDEAALDFLRRQAAQARYVTSVCTGSLVLGAAGLLAGKRATCHWSAIDLLPLIGATPVQERVVEDGNISSPAPASQPASTSPSSLPRCSKARMSRAKSSCKLNMIRTHRSIPARHGPRRAKPSRRLWRGGRS